ncbi:MAG: polyketide cyclase, partial [Hespellia sp.]|nr:polyketide cyclase [Hespellia sp.]
MTISKVQIILFNDIKTVWDLITSLENFSWRSDLSKIEIISQSQFIEYTKNGFPTTFSVTNNIPLERWEFDMENQNMYGHWTGVFS